MNARDELFTILDERPTRAEMLLKVIDEDRMHGSRYLEAECKCVYGWIDHTEGEDRIGSWRLRFGTEQDDGYGPYPAVTPLEDFVGGIRPSQPQSAWWFDGIHDGMPADPDRGAKAKATLRGWIVEWQERRAVVEQVLQEEPAVEAVV